MLWALLAWGNKHFAPEGKSVVIVDSKTGAEADPVLVDRATGRPLVEPDFPFGLGASRQRAHAAALREEAGAGRPTGWTSGRARKQEHASWGAPCSSAKLCFRPACRWDLRRALRQLAIAGAVPLVALTAAWYGHQWWTVGRFIESTDDAYVGGDITVIAPKVAGFISAVAVTDNQAVHAGDLLLKLDDRDYRAALDRATAAVAAQQAALANLDASRRLQEAMVAEATAGIAAADAEVARSEFDLVRYRRLASNEFASIQRLQQADAAHKQAVAAADKARATLAAAERQLEVIDTQKQAAQAALAEAVAGREIAALNLSYTELRAPIDGVVGNRSAHAGAFASVGAQLMSLVPARASGSMPISRRASSP